MKNLVLVAVLLSVVSLPAFAQSKFIKEANTKYAVPEAPAQVQAEKDKPADEEMRADEGEGAVDATGEATAEAPAADEAATAIDAATGKPATDADAELEQSGVEN